MQIDAVHGEQPAAIIAAHRHSGSRQTNIRPMNFHSEPGGASRQPAKEIHHPEVAVGCFPGSGAAFVVAEQAFHFGRNCHRLVGAFGSGPAHFPTRVYDRGLMKAVAKLNSGFGEKHPKRERDEQWPGKTQRREFIADVRGFCRWLRTAPHHQTEQPKSKQTDEQDG